MYTHELSSAISQAFARLQVKLEGFGPATAQRAWSWMGQRSPTSLPEDAYKHPLSYPMLLFPVWIASRLGVEPEGTLQSDLVYSTINGYYAIRMIDDAMDQDNADFELELLPMLHFYLFECHRPYYAHFEVGHAFWDFFEATMFRGVTVTVQDAALQDIDLEHFERITARKTCFAKIPLAAVCYKCGRSDLIPRWAGFVDLFGRWHQMYNDLFDWRRDLESQTRTYFLSEADRRRQQDESVTKWVLREGFDWGTRVLISWMAQLKSCGAVLNCPDMATYLDECEALLLERCETTALGLCSIDQLLTEIERARTRW
jgi:hypothetical protein